MASRYGKLAVTAHRTGSLDFSRYRRGDPYWEIEEYLVLNDIEDELAARMDEMAHLWHAAVGAPGAFETEQDERVEYHRSEARQAFNTVGRLMLPWYKKWKDSDGKTLVDMYRKFKLREKDPEYAAWLQSERARLSNMSKKGISETKALEGAMVELRKQREERQRKIRQGKRHARR